VRESREFRLQCCRVLRCDDRLALAFLRNRSHSDDRPNDTPLTWCHDPGRDLGLLAIAADDPQDEMVKRAEGVIVKVQPIDGGSERVKLTFNTAAVWRDRVRDQAKPRLNEGRRPQGGEFRCNEGGADLSDDDTCSGGRLKNSTGNPTPLADRRAESGIQDCRSGGEEGGFNARSRRENVPPRREGHEALGEGS